jgi:hypothetical protein
VAGSGNEYERERQRRHARRVDEALQIMIELAAGRTPSPEISTVIRRRRQAVGA